jgi:hypothetical protein
MGGIIIYNLSYTVNNVNQISKTGADYGFDERIHELVKREVGLKSRAVPPL